MGPLFLLAALQAAPLGEALRDAVDADGCPRGAGGASGDIVVCGSRKADERYRLPGRDAPFDPAGKMESVMRERSRWAEGGDTGTQSCGPVGPGGWTGCMVRAWERERQQTQYGKNVPTRRW